MSRRIELDVLRGALLLVMALTHLPTGVSAYADQMFGFVSSAEGFVFLSAFVAGCTYARVLRDKGEHELRRRVWRRAAIIYGCHLGLLLFAFTVIAGIAAFAGRSGLKNLLSFYFDQTAWAVVGAPLFLYQPPLLDILPMYVSFMALTPWVLETAKNKGWAKLISLSLLVWIFAQVGGRKLAYDGVQWVTGWPLPIEALGAFDWFAWQVLWMGGLWIGSRATLAGATVPAPTTPDRPRLLALALFTCAVFFVWRHRLGGLWVDLGTAFTMLDKWHLGFLRLLNFVALAYVMSRLVLPALARLRAGLLAALGRASLQAFTAHVLVCLLSLGLIAGEVKSLNSAQQLCVITTALAAMFFVAWRAALRESGLPAMRSPAYASANVSSK